MRGNERTMLPDKTVPLQRVSIETRFRLLSAAGSGAALFCAHVVLCERLDETAGAHRDVEAGAVERLREPETRST